MPDKWQLAYASVVGNAHIKEGLPCQDAHSVCIIEDKVIAIVCDGAGSCLYSDIGSKLVCNYIAEQLNNSLNDSHFVENLSDETWKTYVYELIKACQNELKLFVEAEKKEYRDLSCTLIAMVASPQKILTFHIGDGRGGYKIETGEWQSFMTPFRGEEANETVFITSSIWDDPEKYIETKCIENNIQAFCLLSDGCEKASFQCNIYDETTEKYSDPNLPFPPFFDPNVTALKSLHDSETSQEEINKLWETFLTNGNPKLINETDDKTLVLGVLV